MLPLGHIGVNYVLINIFKRTKTRRDLFLLVVGSLLPDIIDKPLGLILYHGFGNGRLYAHTLLFNVSMLLIILIFRRDWFVLPIASLLHLVEDQMWKQPKILFYPFLGNFPKKPVLSLDERLKRILQAYHDPTILLSDSLGALILLVLIYLIRRQKKLI